MRFPRFRIRLSLPPLPAIPALPPMPPRSPLSQAQWMDHVLALHLAGMGVLSLGYAGYLRFIPSAVIVNAQSVFYNTRFWAVVFFLGAVFIYSTLLAGIMTPQRRWLRLFTARIVFAFLFGWCAAIAIETLAGKLPVGSILVWGFITWRHWLAMRTVYSPPVSTVPMSTRITRALNWLSRLLPYVAACATILLVWALSYLEARRMRPTRSRDLAPVAPLAQAPTPQPAQVGARSRP